MDLPFTAPGQIIPGSKKDLPEFRQLANPNGGSCHSQQPDNSSGGTPLPANPQNQPMTTNCESFNSGIQTQNSRQNPPIQKLNQSEDGPKPRKSSTVCGLPETETCERQTCQTEPVPAATCEPPIRSVVTKAKPCVENDVIPKETTKRDIESNQTNPYNPELGAEAAAIEVSEMITRPTKRIFNLEIKINDQPVTMTIDSGSHISIIGKLIWQQLGQPKLEPITEPWLGVTGSHIPFVGKFMANVNYAGKSLQLPLHVMEHSYATNLLGRVWFPSLHLDWNRIFNSSDVSQCQPDSIEQRQLALKTIQSRTTGSFCVNLNVEGKTIQMMLDTGATVSVISQATWKMLGKPPLRPAPREMFDANQKVIPSIGICMVTVKYNGQEGFLPVFVRRDDYKSIVGTNWFTTMQFDFNSIFEKINFIPPRTTPIIHDPKPQIANWNFIHKIAKVKFCWTNFSVRLIQSF